MSPALLPHPSAPSARSRLWMALGIFGLSLRFALAAISIGCDDAQIWLKHAVTIDHFGMRHALTTQTPGEWHYNHPPLMGYWALLAAHLSDFELAGFSRLLKLPGLFAEIGTAWLVFSIWRTRDSARAAPAFAIYGLSLPLLLVSGYHGNTEPLYIGLSLLAFYIMQDRKQPFYAGLAIAGALNVKLMPLFVIPPLFALCRSRRDAFRLSLGLSLSLLPFAPFLVTSARGMYQNMLAYNSLQFDWGVMALLNHAAETPPFAAFFAALRAFCIATGRYWILASVLAVTGLGFVRKGSDPYALGALGYALFLVLTPGFGVQYTVCVLPFLSVIDLKRATLYSLCAGLMMFFIYTFRMHPQLPLFSLVQYFPCPEVAALCGVLAWGVLVAFVGDQVSRLVKAPTVHVHAGAPPPG